MGGVRDVMGEPDRPPSRAGISIGDTLAAIFATLGGVMALHARERTGRGQVVDSAIYEAVMAVMESLITEFDVVGFCVAVIDEIDARPEFSGLRREGAIIALLAHRCARRDLPVERHSRPGAWRSHVVC